MTQNLPLTRDFHPANSFAIVLCYENYGQLRSIEEAPNYGDLPWVRNDLINARTTIDNFGIPSDNIFEFTERVLTDETKVADKSWN